MIYLRHYFVNMFFCNLIKLLCFFIMKRISLLSCITHHPFTSPPLFLQHPTKLPSFQLQKAPQHKVPPSCRNAFSSYFFFLFSHITTATAIKTTKIPTPIKKALTLTPEEIIIINSIRNASQNPQPNFPGFFRLLITSSYLAHLIVNSLTSLSLSLCK